jgi:mono/diheme cytochrome c family protein
LLGNLTILGYRLAELMKSLHDLKLIELRFLVLYEFVLVLVLVAACQNTVDESNQDSNDLDTPIVPNLPAVSELLGTQSPETGPQPEFRSEELALGKELYLEHCSECHGENLEGEDNWQIQNEDSSFRAPPHDETGHTWHHSDRVLLESIALGGERLPENIGGSSEMPAYKETLTEEEMKAVLIYIKSTWPEDIRAIQWEQTLLDNNQ